MHEGADFSHYESIILDEGHYAREFDRHRDVSAVDFWRRFGGVPDVRGKRVFDFGCGVGGLLHGLMEAGAASAVGIDLDRGALEYGRERMAREWGDRVEMLCQDIREAEFEPADIVVSQNTMEHVAPLEEILGLVVDKCKPGGEMYFGFAPLWHSPYGHHNFPKTNIPWIHLIRGDQIVLDSMNKQLGRSYKTVHEAGFNCKTAAEFRKAFTSQPVEVLSLKRNPGTGGIRTLVSQMLLIPAQLPLLEKYCTTGMYWHLRKLG